MFFHEMHARQADRGAEDYSALVVPHASWDDLDPLELERFRRSIRERRSGDRTLLALPDLELAKALGAVEANGQVRSVRVLSLLLFGKEDSLRRFLPTHEVAFQVLCGQQGEVNDVFRWPLQPVMEEREQRFAARNREEEVLVGMLRWPCLTTRWRPSAKRSPTPSFTATTPAWAPFTCNGMTIAWRLPTPAAFPKASAWTTCW
jgi:ATP-dependent DNA helicase RecG